MAGQFEAVETLDGLHEGDTRKRAAAFHEVSRLYSLEEGGVSDLPRAEWFKMVESRALAKSEGLPRTDHIVSIDVSGL